MKIIIPVALFILLSAFSTFAQTNCTRHVEPVGRFSFCPPEGWTAEVSPSSPYKTFFAPQDGTNMNVKEERVTVSNSEYMAAALKLLLGDNESLGPEATKVVGWTDFTTTSNIHGSRMVYEKLYKGISLRIIQFVFDLPGRKLLLTGTGRESSKTLNDKIFDDVARSLKLTP
ncbi:MAG TPA: hypothetical protein VIU65_12235 [Pyrinomonadaceae bacterium]